MPKLNEQQFSKFQSLIAKNPLAFVATVFFIMFWITYFINLQNSKEEVVFWKKKYDNKDAEVNKLKDDLIESSGIIKIQKEVVEKAVNVLENEDVKESVKQLKKK